MNNAVVYIGLGSNLGDKIRNCKDALSHLLRLPACTLIKRSSWYKTEPWGLEEQDWFVNGVAQLSTFLSPRELLEAGKSIERKLGRLDNGRWGPRTIDIDILFYGNMVLQEADLQIPHPRIHERNFVLVPLAEIAPQILHPVFRKTVQDLLNAAGDHKEVILLSE